MCTLVVAREVFPDKPLLIAANRDEFLSRPSTGPTIWRDGGIPFVAPRDLLAGGTWLGVNAQSVMVAITNRRDVPKRDDRRSRGELVTRALGFPTAKEAAQAMRSLDGSSYNGFHLVIADSASAHLVWGDGERMHASPLSPGIHVVTEAGFLGTTKREQAALAFMQRLTEPHPDALASLLTMHAHEPFDSMCNHADAFGYGTKSSTVMMLGNPGVSMWHCDERPCEGGFVDIANLLAGLRQPDAF